jgi:hypothetical protein
VSNLGALDQNECRRVSRCDSVGLLLLESYNGNYVAVCGNLALISIVLQIILSISRPNQPSDSLPTDHFRGQAPFTSSLALSRPAVPRWNVEILLGALLLNPVVFDSSQLSMLSLEAEFRRDAGGLHWGKGLCQ